MALAAERFSPRWRQALRRAASGHASRRLVAELQAEMVASGVIADVEAMIRDAVASAFVAVEEPCVDPQAAEGLRALARRVAWRDA
jgi:geranylgeranyl diphosphate synthase type I